MNADAPEKQFFCGIGIVNVVIIKFMDQHKTLSNVMDNDTKDGSLGPVKDNGKGENNKSSGLV